MRAIRLFLASLVVIVGTVAISGQGPSSAQITQALRVFLTEAHTWTATQTFKNVVINGTCTGSGCGGGGGGTPGGSTTQVQYNNAGSFGGITGATTNGTALTLVAPILGTPASVTLTNATGLPIGTGVSGLGTGVSTLLGTFSIANLTTALGATGTPSSTTFLRGDNQWATPGGGGSVTSVALTMPSGFTVSGSPVTSSGTLAVSLAAGGVSTLLDTIGNTRGSVLYRGSTGWAILTPGTSGDVLEAQGTGADPIWNTPSGIGLGNFSSTAVASTDGEIVVFNGTSGLSGRNSFAVLSGPATTAKTFTLPNASAAILTSNAAVTVAQGGTGAATLAAHGVLVGAGTSPVAITSAGTTGQVFTSNGASADPTFQPSNSALVLLEQHTASSSATLDFVSWYSSTYDTYLVTLTTVKPATTANQLTLIVSTNGGSTWDSTSGHYAWSHYFNYATSSGVEGGASATYIAVGGGQVSSTIIGVSGTINIFNPSATDFQGFTLSTLRYGTSVSTVVKDDGQGSYTPSAAINGLRFSFTSGNIASGTIRIYGLAK